MRLSRRLTWVVLVLAVAGAVAPGALAGRKNPPAPPPASSPAVVAPAPVVLSMIDIEALR